MENNYIEKLDKSFKNFLSENSNLDESGLSGKVKQFFNQEMISLLRKASDMEGVNKIGDVCDYLHNNGLDSSYSLPIMNYQIAGTRKLKKIEKRLGEVFSTRDNSHEVYK